MLVFSFIVLIPDTKDWRERCTLLESILYFVVSGMLIIFEGDKFTAAVGRGAAWMVASKTESTRKISVDFMVKFC
jgi:hypothetical protein